VIAPKHPAARNYGAGLGEQETASQLCVADQSRPQIELYCCS
jgi:hypothetical protein